MGRDGTDIPQDVKPYLSLNEGVDIDGSPQVAALVGDEFGAGSNEGEVAEAGQGGQQANV